MPFWFNDSDDQRIDRLRRSVRTFDRWRRPLTAFYLLLAIVYTGVVVATALMLEDLGRKAGAVGMARGFVVGLVGGAGLGLTAIKIGHMVGVLLTGLGNERLLIRYHEELSSRNETDMEHSECVEDGY